MTLEERIKEQEEYDKENNLQQALTKLGRIVDQQIHDGEKVDLSEYGIDASKLNLQESPLNQASRMAEERYNADIKNIDDRSALTEFYKVYTEGATKAAERGDAFTYYKDLYVIDKIKDKLGDTTPFTFVKDLASELSVNAGGAATDVLNAGAYAVTSLTDQLNADVLYNVASKNKGTLDNTLENYTWGKENVERLTKLHEQYPEDREIANLYNIVTKQGYTGDKDYINTMASYINSINNKTRYEDFKQSSGTGAVDTLRENIKLRESLGYNSIGQEVLNAAGVVGNMLPSIALGQAAGAAFSGTTAAAAKASETAAKVASLGFMGASAGGNAMNQALNEGAEWGRAGLYGLASGLTEVGTELIGGESVNSLLFGHTVSTPAGKLAKTLVDKIGLKGTFSRGLVSTLLDINAEGFEEVLSQALEPVYKTLILQDPNAFENYGEGLFQAYYESILPTILLGGLGKAGSIKEINYYKNLMQNQIQGSMSLTDVQKGELLKSLDKVTAEAKLGFTENYTEMRDTLGNQLNEADLKNADTLTYALNIAMDEKMSDEQKRTAIQKYAQEHGGVFNDSQATLQELKDISKVSNITYRGTNQINTALENFRKENPTAKIDLVSQINGVQQAIKSLIERETGKQAVYVNPQSQDTKFYGFMQDDNNIYINANLNAKDTLAAANHEIGHYVRTVNPALYKEFLEKAQLDQTKIDNYRNSVNSNLTDEQVKEEMFGDYIGEIKSKYRNTAAVEKSVTSLWDKARQAAQSVGNRVLGNEKQGNVSDYNLGVTSYMNGDILNDRAFEQKVLDAFKSIKSPAKVTKLTTPKVETAKVETNNVIKNDTYARIEEQYKQMRGTKALGTIKNMIAKELGVEYNDNKVDKIYRQLKENNGKITRTGNKYSKRNVDIKQNKEYNANEKRYATAAPYKDNNITEESYNRSRGAVEKQFKRKANEYAKTLGIKITDTYNNMGGFEFKEGKLKGKFVNELSYTFELDNATKEQADLFACLMGDLGYEVQEGVISAKYVDNNSNEGDAVEVRVKIKDLNGVAEALEKAGIRDYTIDRTNKLIKLILAEWSTVKLENILELQKGLGDNYERTNRTNIESEYFDRKARRDAYKKWLQANNTRTKNRSLRNDITKALKLVEEDLAKDKNSEQGSFSYSTRKEDNRDTIINNQQDKIAELQDTNDELKAENKGLKKIIKGIKTTGRQQIRNIQSESNKMLRTGRETELKMKGQLERAGQKYNRLSQAAVDLKFEKQLAEKARVDGISFPREYKDLFVGLRRTGMSISDAYNLTKSIYDRSKAVNTSIDNSIDIIKELRKRSVYNKLPAELKSKIDDYAKIWTGSRQQSDLTLAKRILKSAYARELIGNTAMTKRVRDQIMSMEGYGWENGKGSVSLQELFNGSIELAQEFEQDLLKLREEVKEFQARDMLGERTAELAETIKNIQVAVEDEMDKQDKLKVKRLVKKFTNKTLTNSQMTLKTEIQALMGGNINSPMMAIHDNLQKGEIGKKQAVVEIYRILNDFMQKGAGVNKVLNVEKWNKKLEKSLSNSSEWTDTGIVVETERGKEIKLKLPRSMMMSLAMHLQNDDNMLHISGGATQLSIDDEGKVSVQSGEGQGIRIPNQELFRKGREAEAYDRGVTVKLSHEEVEQIVDMLTDEEKAFVDATKEVFQYTTDLINEVSNRIFGYDLATVENYFPIRVWDRGESKGSEINKPGEAGGRDALNQMLNPGWLEERVTSFNPIYLENIAEVLNRVVNNVSNFYGYAEALRDNKIILDSVMENGTELSKNINYLSSDFMRDYNRLTRYIAGLERQRDGRFRGLMAMNTLTFNVGTWLTQPMSFFNTLKYFNSKEFLTSINPINNNLKLNSMIRNYFDDVGIDHTQYDDYQVARVFIAMATPNLDYRAIGYKIPELNQLFNKNLKNKLGVHGIEAFDNIAVTAIARMMAYSVAMDPNIEFGSEEYFDVLGDRLSQVLVETQPEFSHVNRANMFRSSNPLLRTLSLFGTPANQMFNNFLQSAMYLRYQVREGNTQGIKTAFNGLAKSMSGIIMSSMMVALVRALRDTIRSDDDETEFKDRFIAQSIIAMLGPTLVLDDLAQLIMSTNKYGGVNSYDFNTPETTFLNGITNLYSKLLQVFNEDVSPLKKTTDIVKAMGVITPVDTKGVIRAVTATMQMVNPEAYKAYQLQQNTTMYKKWIQNSDTDMAVFYKAYQATRQSSLEKNYGYVKGSKSGTESAKKQAFERALKDTVPAKDVNKYMEILGGYKS